LNHTFIDSIENTVLNYISSNAHEIKGLISSEGTKDMNYGSIINRRLLISQMKINGVVPGGLFFPDRDIESIRRENEAVLKKTKENEHIPVDLRKGAIEKARKKCKELNDQLEIKRSFLEKNYKRMINDILDTDDDKERTEKRRRIIHDGIKIEVNVSPLCDFAQEKLPYVRLLPGMLIKADEFLGDKINTKSAFNYFSDGVLRFEEEDYKLMFDFRFLYSRNESLLKKISTNFKLRHQILADIQLKLGSHVNRSGVLYVQ